MNKTLALFLFLWFSFCSSAQDSLRVYSWEEALLAPKDSVFRLDASKQKWDSLPAELFTFKQLHYLNISRNHLTTLPTEMKSFPKLKTLDASRNKFDTFPVALCQMTHLRKLLLNRNLIQTIPSCIGYFSHLTTLDLWDNPIVSLPVELMQLTELKTVDLRGILFGPIFQQKWKTQMPDVKWYFDPPCNCLE